MPHAGLPSRKTEAEWRAEQDARTLSEAQDIKSNKPRLSKAKRVAVKMAKNVEKEARNLRVVARTGGKLKVQKPPVRRKK